MSLYFTDVDPAAAELPWRSFTIPSSAPPVRLLRLEVDRSDGSSTSLVRFPPGWSRPDAGHYLVGEEFVVLEGGLTVSGVEYGPGDHGWIPAGATRHGSRTETGALALAWFSGVPDWVDAPGSAPTGEVTPLLTVPIPEGGLPLRSGESSRTRLYERVPAAFTSPARVLFLDGPRWSAYGPGEPVARRPGRAVVHLGLPSHGS
ncbi:cupin domain-containing protein [Actinomadura sp. SCN-SB]|uniref:cupin domain-containing protein n=1 Tax=Actinomadura sp. SCN-SB TaxID=3373092 RepID=UPI003752796B